MSLLSNERVKLSDVLHVLCVTAYNSLISLANSLHEKGDVDRKVALVEYLEKMRVEFVKVLVAVKWSQQLEQLQKREEQKQKIELDREQYRESADLLYTIHHTLHSAKAPLYDIPTAIDVLSFHSFLRLPTSVQIHAPHPALAAIPSKDSQLSNLLDHVLYFRLFTCEIPRQFSAISISK